MSHPASITWFSQHELRLFWRDWVGMLTAGKRQRERLLLLIVTIFLVVIHFIAYAILSPHAESGIVEDKGTLVVVAGSLFLSFCMMISQAMESVTRAFYGRADLDIILSSPASARRLFAVRMGAIALATALLTTVLAGPFINILVYIDGPRWLAAYGLLVSLGILSTVCALALTVLLFRALGPKRTRAISQIVSAIVGAAFVIGVQAAAIFSTGKFSRFEFMQSDDVVQMTPALDSVIWLPAKAAMGHLPAMVIILILSFALLALVISATSGRFGEYVVAAAGVSFQKSQSKKVTHRFRPTSIKAALRRKEWILLRRDPWLMSQTLMQVLYLIPPALLLWKSFGLGSEALMILVPIFVMASGQLAGGLAWLAVSGEDAPDLVASAPLSGFTILQAKVEAVLGAVALVILPMLAILAFAEPWLALVAFFGCIISAFSGTMIQIWYRAQARRTDFRRRQTSSRVATLTEAVASILWAGTAALVAAESHFAWGSAVFVLLVLAGAWAIRPRNTGRE